MFLVCECGRMMGRLEKPFNEQTYHDIILGHREHVLMSMFVPPAWRLGANPNPAVRRLEILEQAQLPPWYGKGSQ